MNRLALSMIVRDAERDLPACLASVRGVVDEMVIADTGSTDSTVEVARAHGAHVIHVPWEHDFARARNLALAPVQSEWVLSLDADERLGSAAPHSVRPLLARPGVGGYLLTIRNYVLSAEERLWDRPSIPNDFQLQEARRYPAFLEHENVRLFRRHPAIAFTGRVHESVGPALRQAGFALDRAPLLIHHLGLAASSETRARKNTYYRELGRRKVQESPENAQAHFELGLVELDNFHNYQAALECFERACALNAGFGVAWFFQGVTRSKCGDYAGALHCLRRAEACSHGTALNAETQGDAHYNLGDFAAARRCYRKALERGAARELESKLGLAELREGRVASGLEKLRRARDSKPANGELHDRLILALVWLERLEEAAEMAALKTRHAPSPETFLRAAALHARAGKPGQAADFLVAGTKQYPGDARLRSALAELHASTGKELTEREQSGAGRGTEGAKSAKAQPPPGR